MLLQLCSRKCRLHNNCLTDTICCATQTLFLLTVATSLIRQTQPPQQVCLQQSSSRVAVYNIQASGLRFAPGWKLWQRGAPVLIICCSFWALAMHCCILFRMSCCCCWEDWGAVPGVAPPANGCMAGFTAGWYGCMAGLYTGWPQVGWFGAVDTCPSHLPLDT